MHLRTFNIYLVTILFFPSRIKHTNRTTLCVVEAVFSSLVYVQTVTRTVQYEYAENENNRPTNKNAL